MSALKPSVNGSTAGRSRAPCRWRRPTTSASSGSPPFRRRLSSDCCANATASLRGSLRPRQYSVPHTIQEQPTGWRRRSSAWHPNKRWTIFSFRSYRRRRLRSVESLSMKRAHRRPCDANVDGPSEQWRRRRCQYEPERRARTVQIGSVTSGTYRLAAGVPTIGTARDGARTGSGASLRSRVAFTSAVLRLRQSAALPLPGVPAPIRDEGATPA